MPVFLSKRTMADLLVTCFEGGSNYWVAEAEYIPPEGMSLKELQKMAFEAADPDAKELWRAEPGRAPMYALLPFLPPSVGWKIRFHYEEEDYSMGHADLDPNKMREAAPKLAKAYPHLFKEIKEEQWDAGSADAWLQMGVFGEVVFG